MKNIKRVMCVVLMLCMIVPMTIVGSFASEASDVVAANWYTIGAKYSSRNNAIIAPAVDGVKVVKSEGFTFTENENGGIDVHVPDYETFQGAVPVAMVTSKTPVALGGLEVEVTLAEDSYYFKDSKGFYNNWSMHWTKDPLTEVANPTDGTGMMDASAAVTNGIRTVGPIDKVGLYVIVGGGDPLNADTKIASFVNIYLFDGVFTDAIDGEGVPGYRWTFAARNMPEVGGAGLNGDSSNIVRGHEHIDLSEGLTFKIKSDSTLGYKVYVNGKSYYKGKEVGYFPSNVKFDDDDRKNLTPIYLQSMEYAKDDIDLSALTAVEEGYVSVIGVGNLASHTKAWPVAHLDFTVDTINDDPAASFGTWEKEWTVTKEATCTEEGLKVRNSTTGRQISKVIKALGHQLDEGVVTKEPTCTEAGVKTFTCARCGETTTEEIPALGHDWSAGDVTKEPTCTEAGTKEFVCIRCGEQLTETIDALGHDWNEGEVTKEPTCTEAGEKIATCARCNLTDTLEIPALGHTPGDAVKENEVAATCTEAGSYDEVVYCTVCGAEISREAKAVAALGHKWSAWKEVKPATIESEGVKTRTCSVCGAEESKKIDKLAPNNPFIDVPAKGWFTAGALYCNAKGYMTGTDATHFSPNANFTRAMFVVVLSKIDGADISKYTTQLFDDVKPGWYFKAVNWAKSNDYASGLSETTFGPDAPVTREQLAMFLYKYASKNGKDVSKLADISGYPDVAKVSGYAKTAIRWAVGAEMISGVKVGDETTLAPQGLATRAQVALIIQKFVQNILGK